MYVLPVRNVYYVLNDKHKLTLTYCEFGWLLQDSLTPSFIRRYYPFQLYVIPMHMFSRADTSGRAV
jgi:hypothetical protein